MGWYENTCKSREQVVLGLNNDIVVLVETHLPGDRKISIDSYESFMHNRKERNIRLNRNFGGIAILVKKHILNSYKFIEIDKQIDGIFIAKLINIASGYCIIIIACYLPPERSVWGRNASGFFEHILNYVYLVAECDALFLMGDINARIGSKQDFIQEVDQVKNRIVLDKTVNKHGEVFHEFLLDAKMCLVNSRVTPDFDNYTCVSSKGRSVVDYIAVPMNNIENCIKCEVKTARSMIDEFCDISDADLNVRGMVPDHSVLLLEFKIDVNVNNTNTTNNMNNVSEASNVNDHIPDNYFTRYNVRGANVDFFSSEESKLELLRLIENIEQCRSVQDDIDAAYKHLIDTYHNEMNKWFRAKNVHPSSKKRLHRSTKPFWNDQLQNLWNVLCESEKAFLASSGAQRRVLHAKFKSDQRLFDRTYRKTERSFKLEQLIEIDESCTSDHKKFWELLQKLGPKRQSQIPIEIVDNEGKISNNINDVLNKWRSDYETLFTFEPQEGEFDTNFYTNIINSLADLEQTCRELNGLNHEISESEIASVIKDAKLSKSVGLDNLPNEILKNEATIQVLTVLFRKIFANSVIPTIWKYGILKPIPKSSMTDPCIPLQYRGICLLSTVYKLFSNVLNKRIVSTAEEHDLFSDEQNGFRKHRSCIDHIFTLTSIIRNRKNKRLPTFAAFIDFEKAFDRVDRQLLFHKLMQMGVSGKILDCIRNIYHDCKCGVDLNGNITDWFSCNYGVRQGDVLSPTLFGLYINDLVKALKDGASGITIDDFVIVCLLYADDLVLLSENEEDLQTMLNILNDWCRKWRMRINVNKSKILHFRIPSQTRTTYDFKIGNISLEIVNRYKYLGLVLDEHLDFNTTSSILSESAGRALGSICSKFKSNKGFGYNTYSKLFECGVAPILDYCSGVWGFGKHEKADTIQNRAIRFYLGVHRFAPNLAINADMGWLYSRTRRKVEMVRFWNRMHIMDDTRLTKKVFLWDKSICKRNWNSEIKQIFSETQSLDSFVNQTSLDVRYVKRVLHENVCNDWLDEVQKVPKLRTYVKFKREYCPEPYLKSVLNRQHRSALAQIRCGILPLSIETGRYLNIPEEYRLCLLCDQNVTESETHFIFHCSKYASLREQYFEEIAHVHPNFLALSDDDKFVILMSESSVKKTANFVCQCFELRRKSMYITT